VSKWHGVRDEADHRGLEGVGGRDGTGGPTAQARDQTGTHYPWKAKYGGTEVSEAKRLKALEDENRRLKRLVADQALDIQMLKEIFS
jgi:hypothetical protein